MLVARCTNTPKHHVRAVLAACGFGNSTGLPITLLTVVHTNFPVTSDLGRVDPTLFLSVYLLLFPVLQWGLGGYLLAAPVEDPVQYSTKPNQHDFRRGTSFRHNVLNHHKYKGSKHKGLTSTDEGLYMTEIDLTKLLGKVASEPTRINAMADVSQRSEEEQRLLPVSTDLLEYEITENDTAYGHYNDEDLHEYRNSEKAQNGHEEKEGLMKKSIAPHYDFDADSMWQTISNVLDRCFQPPVVGAVLGIICAVVPRLRGVFVDLIDRDSTAPLQFLFDGLYAVGQAAVPLNMYVTFNFFFCADTQPHNYA